MIRLNNICKHYKVNNTVALDNIDLAIDHGELVAIRGKSGAGKSTLINIIGFLDNFSSGDYYFQSEKIEQNAYKKQLKLRSKNIGFVVQNFALIPDHTIFYNISLPLLYQGYSKQKIESRVHEVAKRMNIDTLLNKLPQHISGGESQRAAIARALVNKPDLILADEPTASLDEKNEEIIIEYFKELNREGITIIIVTHDHSVANQCNRVIDLSDGKITSDNRIQD